MDANSSLLIDLESENVSIGQGPFWTTVLTSYPQQYLHDTNSEEIS